jgi:hypothetical protein
VALPGVSDLLELGGINLGSLELESESKSRTIRLSRDSNATKSNTSYK